MALEPTWAHLDPLGGIAGDMFAAALLDARPELEEGLAEAIAGAGVPAGVRLRRDAHRDHALTGSQISVEVPGGSPPSGRYAAIVERLTGSDLAAGAKARALDIYRRLAEAEARVHGVPLADVHFHELADWDSYVDVVAAASLIERLAAAGWSCGPVPLGRGRVMTSHGALPVPAPATALLLQGLEVLDDGIPGERVTPTGAAILAHLEPATLAAGGRVAAAGHGFGSRRLEGAPNLLRVLLLSARPKSEADRVGVIRFEIDDQTSEDLAIALDRLRALDGVRDVCQWPAGGARCRDDGLPRRDRDDRPALARRDPPDASARDRRAQRRHRQARPSTGWRHDRQGRERGNRRRGRLCRARPPAPGGRGGRERLMSAGDAHRRLIDVLDGIGYVAIAVSGGVDSMTLATAAGRRLGDRLAAFHAASAAVPPEATRRVRDLAGREGWRLQVIDAGELADPRYLANPVDRCWFCKMDLYGAIRRHTDWPMASGANLDDLGDYRPGLRAAARHAVRHPLIEAGLDKAAVRALAAALGLHDLAELPASPCLSSRVETGLEVTPGRLALILDVERELQQALPGAVLRCRLRREGLVIEVEPDRLPQVDRPALMALVAGIARRHGVDETAGVAPYMRGSAFLHGR
jgi:uncharacterized protein (DUF111 family)/PP-loop superfamily ATP-utilizing enzyme